MGLRLAGRLALVAVAVSAGYLLAASTLDPRPPYETMQPRPPEAVISAAVTEVTLKSATFWGACHGGQLRAAQICLATVPSSTGSRAGRT